MNQDHVRRCFRAHFGGDPRHVAVAPGRVNLIGEHTDYNDGFVFPAAIDRELWVAADLAPGPTTLLSEQAGEGANFDAPTVVPGQASGWAAYPAGMAWALREATGKPVPNLRVAVSSSIPLGSGVSSSAAIEMAFGVLWNRVADLGLDNKALAMVAHRCEREFVGVNCGVMDMMASALGRAGHAMFLDTRTLDVRYAPLPEGTAIVLCDTRMPRTLAGSAYNERRARCESAAATLGKRALRDATLEELFARAGEMEPTTFQRAMHVITENDRTLSFSDALERGLTPRIGDLMRASHDSLRVDYEVTIPELDAMVEAAWSAPGCVGARMTGAGFGGAAVALVEQDAIEPFLSSVDAEFRLRAGREGAFHVCAAVDGARTVSR
ncbi:MAG: galactokinase [Fimbriimonadaceae bacterium]|nr:galactokinase [Fimbriimonadaceae bacterium]